MESIVVDSPDIALTSPLSQINLWSRYKRIHDIIKNPIHPLIVVIGSNTCTGHIKKLI